MNFRNWSQLHTTPFYLLRKLLAVNVPTGSQMCSLVTLFSLKHFRVVTGRGRRTPEWYIHGCISSVTLAVTVLNMDWRFPFCCSSNKAHSWVPAVLSWKEEAYVLLLSEEMSAKSIHFNLYWKLKMCYGAFSGLNVYFRRFITSIW